MLSALERGAGKRTKTNISDSLAQTKRKDQEFEIIEDFDSVLLDAIAESYVRSSPDPRQFPLSHPQRRKVDEPRTEQWTFRGLALLSSILDVRAAILSVRSGETSFSDVSRKLRSQRSDADLASCDHRIARKGHERRHGNAHLVDGSDDDEEAAQDQHGEFHDGAHEPCAHDAAAAFAPTF